jgi:transposase InsO family protein
MKALANERRRFGYRRLHVLLRRERQLVNHKKLFRLYREEKQMSSFCEARTDQHVLPGENRSPPTRLVGPSSSNVIRDTSDPNLHA